MSFKLGTRVRHQISGEVGVVLGVEDSVARVSFPNAIQFINLRDLEAIYSDDLELAVSADDFDADAARLKLIARLIQHSYEFDAGAGVSNARLNPQLHQAFVAHRVVARKVVPRMILADEVGLGKTIEAGLILKELRARHLVKRALVIAPASLTVQWQSELRSKFNEIFEIMDGDSAKHFGRGGTNPFETANNIIASLPFASNKKRAEQILEADWDLVIFDEAHRVRKSASRVTLAYKLAEEISTLTHGLLLLTATPVQLNAGELLSLIDLTEPGLFRDEDDFERTRRTIPELNDMFKLVEQWLIKSESDREKGWNRHAARFNALGVQSPEDLADYEQQSELLDRLIELHPTADVLIRNRKADLNLSNTRTALTVPVAMNDDEIEVYENITRYVREFKTDKDANLSVSGFSMVVYQKLVSSSAYALHTSLSKRITTLRNRLEKVPAVTLEVINEAHELAEAETLVEIAEALPATSKQVDSLAEISFLENLCGKLEHIQDSKAFKLAEILREQLSDDGSKLVIFTQFRATQTFLSQLLDDWGYSHAIFHGQLTVEEKEFAIRSFREGSQVLISTESGGEGRNLQFAHILVNYDLPWNPMRIEQRIGRIDRIGQTRPIKIFNLVYEGTIEERIVEVLTNRIRIFEESIGSLDPILSSVEHELEKIALSADFDSDADALASYGEELQRLVNEARLKERVFEDFVLDRASFRADDAQEWMDVPPLASPANIQKLFEIGLRHLGATIDEHAEGGHEISLSAETAAKYKQTIRFAHGYFDSQVALEKDETEFFACGHPFVDVLLQAFTKLEKAEISYRQADDLEADWALEVIWKHTAKIVVPEARLIKHIVSSEGTLSIHEDIQLPLLETPVEFHVDMNMISSAAQISRSQARVDRQAFENKMMGQSQHTIQKRLRRLERVFETRRKALENRNRQDQDWLDAAAIDGDPKKLKILPARRGQLEKRREQLEILKATYLQESEELEGASPDIRSELFSVSILRGKKWDQSPTE